MVIQAVIVIEQRMRFLDVARARGSQGDCCEGPYLEDHDKGYYKDSLWVLGIGFLQGSGKVPLIITASCKGFRFSFGLRRV